MLKDIDSVEKRIAKATALAKSSKNNPQQQKELTAELALLQELNTALNVLNLSRVQELLKNATVQTVPLLSAKNFLIIANLGEDEIANDGFKQNKHYQNLVKRFGESRVIPISARLEFELSQLEEADRIEMRTMLGVEKRRITSHH